MLALCICQFSPVGGVIGAGPFKFSLITSAIVVLSATSSGALTKTQQAIHHVSSKKNN